MYDKMGSKEKDTAEFKFGLINKESQEPASVVGTDGITFTFSDLKQIKKDSFLDYLKGGCEIGLQIAIDFTGSNGNPKSNDSLHNMNMDKN